MKMVNLPTMVGRLGVVGFLLFALGACQDVQPTSGNSTSAPQAGMDSDPVTDTQREEELNVHLEAVEQPRPAASLGRRDPFRFGPASGGFGADTGRGAPVPQGDTVGPPSVPTTPVLPRSQIRMIGLVEGADTLGRVAVLTDRGQVFHGRAGDIVEGTYRVVTIGPDSVQLESVHDGRRQVLRLPAM